MKIAVVGTGGLGGYFGGRLAFAGEDVQFIARGAHLAALQAHGLRVESVLGDFALSGADTQATADPATIGPCDIVLFTVKSYDTESAAREILPSLVGPETAVISLQNGIDNEEKLAAIIGPGHVVGGAAYIFAGIAEPGLIRHTGGPARLVFGELDGRASPRLERFRAACERAGIKAELTEAVQSALWTKYAFICAVAGLTAATRRSIGVIRQTPATWQLFRDVLQEAVDVGRAEGVALPDDLVDRHVAAAEGLAPMLYSSLHDDLVAGRRIELEATLGELVRRAARAGVDARASATLYAVILAQAARSEHSSG
jgi:2-dehydropantoate 2-reductase